MEIITYESVLSREEVPEAPERTASQLAVDVTMGAIRGVAGAVASVANVFSPVTGLELDRVTLNNPHRYDGPYDPREQD